MQKINLYLITILISSFTSIANAHQILNDYQTNGWNWNNGSHGNYIVMDGENSGIISPKNSKSKFSRSKTFDKKSAGNKQPNKVVKYQIDKDTNNRQPMFDAGIRPSNSK